MSTVFLDTVGVLALWDQRDQWHSAAVEAFDRLQSKSATLITTDLVLYETANASARKPYRYRVTALRHEFAADGRLCQRRALSSTQRGRRTIAGMPVTRELSTRYHFK